MVRWGCEAKVERLAVFRLDVPVVAGDVCVEKRRIRMPGIDGAVVNGGARVAFEVDHVEPVRCSGINPRHDADPTGLVDRSIVPAFAVRERVGRVCPIERVCRIEKDAKHILRGRVRRPAGDVGGITGRAHDAVDTAEPGGQVRERAAVVAIEVGAAVALRGP